MKWVALIIAVIGIGLWFFYRSPKLQNQEPISQSHDTLTIPLIPEGDVR